MAKVLRIIGQNGGGGARVHIFQLNEHLEKMGDSTVTLIPPPNFKDPLTFSDIVPFKYVHYSNLYEAFRLLRDNLVGATYVHSHLRNASVLASIVSGKRRPHIVTIHTPVLSSVPSIRESIFRLLMLKVLRDAAGVIFISEYIRDLTYSQFGPALRLKKEAVIYNGSSEAKDYTRTLSENIRLCLVGELTDRKGMSDFVDLLKIVSRSAGSKHFVFNVFGKGPWGPKLHALCEDYPFLKMHGYEDNPKKIYCNNDLNLMLGRTEAFGRTITEAKSFGVPTIAFRAGAFPELVRDGIDGFLCDDSNEIFNCLEKISRDRDLLSRLSFGAKADFMSRFSSEVFVSNTALFLRDVLERYVETGHVRES